MKADGLGPALVSGAAPLVEIAGLDEIVAMTRLDAIKAERERCAKIIEEWSFSDAEDHKDIADFIRGGKYE